MAEPPKKIGPYQIIRKIGEGGMGAVFEGIHELIERKVAIKVLHAEYAQRPEFIARFFNEARAVNRIDHPGLVQISDYGQLPDNTAYIVMELLNGESLSARMKKSVGPLGIDQVLNFGSQFADSLAAAHEEGVLLADAETKERLRVAQILVMRRNGYLLCLF
jgi:serine/threonine protein kinase